MKNTWSLHPELKVKYNIQHSLHSKKRCNLRGIEENDIQIALNYSKSIFKQGLVFHVVKDKLIPDDIANEVVGRIRNLIVVMAGDEGRIITCYRSENGMKHIKRKSKRLETYTYNFMN